MLIILAIAAILAAFLFFYLLPAIRFLKSFARSLGENSAHPSNRFNVGAINHATDSTIKIEVYSHKQNARCTLITIPGLHPAGIYDPRFRAFAASCAEAGFYVVAPDIEDFRNLKVTPESVSQIDLVLQEVRSFVPEVALQNLGILGISYGAGPAFLAAAKYTAAPGIRFLISVGGYYEFAHCLQFVVRGIHESQGELHVRQPQEWGRLIFALNYLENFGVSEPDQIRAVLLLHLNFKADQAHLAANALSAASAEFIHEVLNGFSDANLEIYQRIMDRDQQIHHELSPAAVVEEFDRTARFYLLHGKNDDLVPYEETIELRNALRAAGRQNVHSLVTASLSHVDLKQAEDFFGAAGMLFWLRSVIGEIKR